MNEQYPILEVKNLEVKRGGTTSLGYFILFNSRR